MPRAQQLLQKRGIKFKPSGKQAANVDVSPAAMDAYKEAISAKRAKKAFSGYLPIVATVGVGALVLGGVYFLLRR